MIVSQFNKSILRVLLLGTALAVLPAIPFYVYTFDATPSQLGVLIPLFLPALAGMLVTDLVLMAWYLRPIREFLKAEEQSRPLPESFLFLAKQRALNLPMFSVGRVFLPHAVIGSGIYNLMILYANAKLQLGINPDDFPVYWAINLTVVPVGHAVYEYFGIASVISPVLEMLESRVPELPRAFQNRILRVGLATKVILIFLMLGTAPLLILGLSLNRKHTSLLIGKEREHLRREAEFYASVLPGLAPEQRDQILQNRASAEIVLVQDETGSVIFRPDTANREQQKPLREFLHDPAILLLTTDDVVAAKARTFDRRFVVAVASPLDLLTRESTGLRFGTISIIAVGIVLMAALLILLGKDISRSTKRLVGALKRVEEGSFHHSVKLYTTDEFSIIGNGFNRMLAGLRERNLIKDTFGKYVAPTVVEKVLETARNRQAGDGGELRLAGERRVVTIMFSDVRDFTKRTEESSAEAIVELMNEYYERMVNVVDRYEGTVDKFIGDAIMVLFGAPLSKSDDADRAVGAALGMRAELQELNRQLRKRRVKPLQIGIGIHTGEVIAGNIGSTNRLEYTVVGDAVNVASRIEGLTKKFKSDILLSEATVQSLQGECRLKRMGRVKVKGKRHSIVVYKALS